MPLLRQELGHRETGNAGSYHRHTVACTRGTIRTPSHLLSMAVRQEPLDMPYGQGGPVVFSMRASPLAGMGLGTDPSKNLGHVVRTTKDLGGSIEIPVLRQPEGQGDIGQERASGDAGLIGTVKAACRLPDHHFRCPGETDLVEVPDTVSHREKGRLHGACTQPLCSVEVSGVRWGQHGPPSLRVR
jgi:hypothetical protein